MATCMYWQSSKKWMFDFIEEWGCGSHIDYMIKFSSTLPWQVSCASGLAFISCGFGCMDGLFLRRHLKIHQVVFGHHNDWVKLLAFSLQRWRMPYVLQCVWWSLITKSFPSPSAKNIPIEKLAIEDKRQSFDFIFYSHLGNWKKSYIYFLLFQ